MAKTNKRYAFDPTILRLRLSNWERILATKTTVDFRRQHADRLALLEQRLAQLEAELATPTHRPTDTARRLADKLRTQWKGGPTR